MFLTQAFTLMCNRPGAGDLGLTEDDMNLMYSKYERSGAFNYYAFCKVKGAGCRVQGAGCRVQGW